MTTKTQPSEPEHLRIGLALSGGGFRASIFHLGVIRRLEELGIMKQVAVVSSVSGGSIIAGYYIIEMEKRLRERRKEIENAPQTIDKVRLELFEEIAHDFFGALDHNLRTRALVFSPFYHPLQWLKTLTPRQSRSDLIQGEYDRWFYYGNTLDELPAVIRGDSETSLVTAGPKLVLNTTSLMTGERVGFSRVPISGINEQKKSPLFRTVSRERVLTENRLHRTDVLRMIKRRACDANLPDNLCCHTFRATGITVFLQNGGLLEQAQKIAAHESVRTTKLYDRREDAISLDEIERIAI